MEENKKEKKTTKGEKFIILNKCLHCLHYRMRGRRPTLQLILPKELQEKMIEANHDNLTTGHFGITKTYQRINQWYYWPNMLNNVSDWVKACQVCQRRKPSHKKPQELLKPILATRPFEIMGMDVLSKLPTTLHGNCNIIVIIDYFTK